MRQLRDILRLKFESGLSHRAIAQACSVGVGTASEYVGRAKRAGLTWPLPEELNDSALEAKLFPPRPQSDASRPLPDVAEIHQELKRPGVTLRLLWIEYPAVHPSGYRYSQFCERYRQFANKFKPSMWYHFGGQVTCERELGPNLLASPMDNVVFGTSAYIFGTFGPEIGTAARLERVAPLSSDRLMYGGAEVAVHPRVGSSSYEGFAAAGVSYAR